MSLETVIEVDHSKGSVDTSECEKVLFLVFCNWFHIAKPSLVSLIKMI